MHLQVFYPKKIQLILITMQILNIPQKFENVRMRGYNISNRHDTDEIVMFIVFQKKTIDYKFQFFIFFG